MDERRWGSGRWRIVGILAATVNLGLAGPAPARGADDDPTYRTATGLLNRGMYDLATGEYRKFLKERPGDPRAVTARYGLAVCLSRLGKPGEAADELDRVLKEESFEFRADALLLRGRCHLEAGEFDRAAARLAQVRAEFPDSPRAGAALALEGEALYRAGQFEMARPVVERAERAAAAGEEKVRAGYLLAMTDAALGQEREAAERLETLGKVATDGDWPGRLALCEAGCRERLGEGERAAALYKRAADCSEEAVSRPALLGLGRVLRKSGDLDGAAGALERVLRAGDAVEVDAARLELAKCWLAARQPGRALEVLSAEGEWRGVRADERAYWLARAEAGAGRHAEAAARLEQALKDAPKSELAPNMLYDRAVALSRAGRAEDAPAAFEALARRYPDHELAGEAVLARASLLHESGEYSESASICRGLLDDADPARRSTARLLLAENAYLSERWADAERAYAAFLKDAPQDARAWRAEVRRGLALMKLGRGEEARPGLERAMKAEGPGTEPALKAAAAVAMGDLAFEAEEWKDAERWYAMADPDDAVARLKLGLSVHRQERPAEAVAIYEQVIQAAGLADGPGLHAAFERGQALAELGKLDEARAALEAVIAAERAGDGKFSGHALRRLASIAAEQGRPGEAAELLSKSPGGGVEVELERGAALLAAGNAREAEQVLRAVLGAEDISGPASRKAAAQVAIAVSRQERYEEALGLIEQLNGEDVGESLRPALNYERAWALKALGRGDEAAKAYRELLEGEPPPALAGPAALDLAQLELAAGRPEAALGWVDRAADAPATAASRAYLKGAALFKLERWKEAAAALSAFDGAFAGEPAAGPASLLMGEALLKAGDAKAAVERLRRASEAQDPKVRGPALLRLGEALGAQERWLESEETLLAYLKEFGAEPVWFQARFGVGWAREQQGKYESAMESYREVVDRYDGPTAARAQFQIGECLFALNRHDEAVKELLKVDILYAYPEWSAAALYEAGRCLEAAGKPGEARSQYSVVVERFKDSEWAGPAAERLRGLAPAALPGQGTEQSAARDAGRNGR